jgi:hypothetical protein
MDEKEMIIIWFCRRTLLTVLDTRTPPGVLEGSAEIFSSILEAAIDPGAA